MRDVVRALLIAATLLLLSAPAHFGSTPSSFAIVTALMIAVNAVLVFTFTAAEPATQPIAPRTGAAVLVAIAGVLLVASAARAWLNEILIYPNDPYRADMLVVVQEGIKRFLRGENPYTIYHVPWEATLPYGPMLWLPYVVPYVLRIDVRFASLLGALCVPIACASAATAYARTGRYAAAAGALTMIGAMAASADLRGFASIAHTPVYWPLLLLFAWFTAREHWLGAAILCGLLIVARSTMIAIAPVLMIAVWHRDRRRAAAAGLALALAAALPYLPFAIWNRASLVYALYGSYQSLMKGFVWTSTTWAHATIGITGLLLRNGLQRGSEAVQAVLMAGVYFAAYRAVCAGSPPLGWAAAALFAFSATTLWPVSYIYFDVFVLWTAAALAAAGWPPSRRIISTWGLMLGASAALLVVAALIDVRADPTIDIGIGASRQALYKGFSNDEGDAPSFAWIDGTNAEILIARRSRTEAAIDLRIEPFLPSAASTQQVSATLNGVLIGTSTLEQGWQTLTLHAPARAWRIGVNELVLSLSQAVSPRDARLGDDSRKLSAAVDRLTVRTKL